MCFFKSPPVKNFYMLILKRMDIKTEIPYPKTDRGYYQLESLSKFLHEYLYKGKTIWVVRHGADKNFKSYLSRTGEVSANPFDEEVWTLYKQVSEWVEPRKEALVRALQERRDAERALKEERERIALEKELEKQRVRRAQRNKMLAGEEVNSETESEPNKGGRRKTRKNRK